MAKVFTCELDGVVMRGESDDELVASVERHLAAMHPELIGTLTRDEILANVRAEGTEEPVMTRAVTGQRPQR